MTAVQTRWTSNESRVKWKERVSTPLRLTGLSIRNASYPALPAALRTSADWNNKYLCHGTLQTRRTLSFVTTSRN